MPDDPTTPLAAALHEAAHRLEDSGCSVAHEDYYRRLEAALRAAPVDAGPATEIDRLRLFDDGLKALGAAETLRDTVSVATYHEYGRDVATLASLQAQVAQGNFLGEIARSMRAIEIYLTKEVESIASQQADQPDAH